MDLSWALPHGHHSEYCPCVEFMPVQWRYIMPQTAALTTAAFALAPAAITAATAAITAATASITAAITAQTSAAWLGFRGTPRSPTVPSPPGLCAGPPAGRPPDGVHTAQLLGTGASGLRRHAQARPREARTGRPSGAPAASVLLLEQ
jgi:hypothetical protein